MFTLLSSEFSHEGPIPARFTCEGDELSPPLRWQDAPEGTRSFVLIVDDPDSPDPAAPRRVWVHWLRYNIPATSTELLEDAGGREPRDGSIDALTDDQSRGYHGPCPPIGRHRYFFRLFALDAELPNLGAQADRGHVERAMDGHVLGTAILMGTYTRGP